jgi:hypothetical protein
MRREQLKPGQIYAVRAVDRAVVPGVVLDSALWDLVPEEGRVVFRPAPPEEKWPTTLDREVGISGGRRGVLIVLPPVGARPTKAMVASLKRLGRLAERLRLPERGEEAATEFQAALEPPLRLEALHHAKILMAWDRHVSGQGLRACPACGALVPMSAASKIRSHSLPDGTNCARSNTQLTEEERNRESA